ncbi:FRG domain-containing protein [Adhaeribacter terrigena]|uniref:FRG domain-containing protein n=1 Tax=Adhaeribacter terrigena TaxID=2793070 RepID=UPI001F36BB0D|nr:FRG domain-containing protein [Adhaeribacter terrigena]
MSGRKFAHLEPHILRNFKKYAHRDASPGSSVWNWLAVAQHHGLPTRLLDWTFSPYVALHFATAKIENFHCDGVIWCMNNLKTNEFLPQKLREVITEEGSNVFTAEMLEPVCASLKELAGLQKEEFVLFLEPPSLDQRIVHQYALFSVMSTAEARLHDWLGNHPDLYFRIVIPAKLKWEIRNKLDQANITERVLFPGLKGLSQLLKRQYTTL